MQLGQNRKYAGKLNENTIEVFEFVFRMRQIFCKLLVELTKVSFHSNWRIRKMGFAFQFSNVSRFGDTQCHFAWSLYLGSIDRLLQLSMLTGTRGCGIEIRVIFKHSHQIERVEFCYLHISSLTRKREKSNLCHLDFVNHIIRVVLDITVWLCFKIEMLTLNERIWKTNSKDINNSSTVINYACTLRMLQNMKACTSVINSVWKTKLTYSLQTILRCSMTLRPYRLNPRW